MVADPRFTRFYAPPEKGAVGQSRMVASCAVALLGGEFIVTLPKVDNQKFGAERNDAKAAKED